MNKMLSAHSPIETSWSFHTVCRCARSPRSNVSVNTLPLIDFSRASHLDFFEQPEIRFFKPVMALARKTGRISVMFDSPGAGFVKIQLQQRRQFHACNHRALYRRLKHPLSLTRGISPMGEGVNHILARARSNRSSSSSAALRSNRLKSETSTKNLRSITSTCW